MWEWLSNNANELKTGYNNVVLGLNNLNSGNNPYYNIAIGVQSLYKNNSHDNIGLGIQPLYNNINGLNNISFGTKSLFYNISGSNSIAIGGNSLYLIGNVIVYNRGTIRGNITTQTASLVNSGTIELRESHNYGFNYIHNLVNESTGKLIIALKTDGTQAGTQYSKIYTDSTIFSDDSTIDVNVLDSS